jgi:hypothetical protein
MARCLTRNCLHRHSQSVRRQMGVPKDHIKIRMTQQISNGIEVRSWNRKSTSLARLNTAQRCGRQCS